MEWKDRKVLVTGGAGMIGSTLVEKLVEAGAVVTVADNLWRGRIENLKRDGNPVINMDANFVKADLTGYENCLKVTRGQEIVYHLADVVAGINYVFGNQFSLFHSNVVMNSNIVHAAISSQVKTFIYVGTACSYPYEKQNKLNAEPLREEDAYPANPESSYGWSKLMGEYECQLAEKEGLLDVGILRLHNVYGPKCDMSAETSQVIPALIRKAISYPDEKFIVWGSGKQRRAFVYIDDVVDALVAVCEKGIGQGVIQIGPDKSVSIGEIAKLIVEISRRDVPIEFDTSKMEGDLDRTADWSRAARVLGWRPRIGIKTGLEKTYLWCEKNIEHYSVANIGQAYQV
jgi:GDP-D-mannose 3', 5'-epimerase